MTAAGLAAFERRTEKKSRTYSYEQKSAARLAPAEESAFKKHKAAWAFFEAQPLSYRTKALWWVVSARQQATRDKRLATLIEACGKGQRL